MIAIIINGVTFREKPFLCGLCQASIHDNGKLCWCRWLDLNKHKFDAVPKRCATIFDKAFASGPGSYVITVGGKAR